MKSHKRGDAISVMPPAASPIRTPSVRTCHISLPGLPPEPAELPSPCGAPWPGLGRNSRGSHRRSRAPCRSSPSAVRQESGIARLPFSMKYAGGSVSIAEVSCSRPSVCFGPLPQSPSVQPRACRAVTSGLSLPTTRNRDSSASLAESRPGSTRVCIASGIHRSGGTGGNPVSDEVNWRDSNNRDGRPVQQNGLPKPPRRSP